MGTEQPNTYFDLFVGYSAFWVLFSVLLFVTMRQTRRLAHRLEMIELRTRQQGSVGIHQEASSEYGQSL